MSDTPLGGWWKAKDGKWYPPETHPDHASIAAEQERTGPPAQGWWQASDGNWYPPETHPEHRADGGPPTIEADSVEAQPTAPGEHDGSPIDPVSSGTTEVESQEPARLGAPAAGVSVTAGTGADEPVEIDLTDEPGGGSTADVVTPASAPGAALPSMPAPSTGTMLPGAAAARPASRRGLFDLVPPEEDPVAAPPPVQGRPLFGGSAPSAVEQTATDAGSAAPVVESRSSLPSMGSVATGAGGVLAAGAAVGAGASPGARTPSNDDDPQWPTEAPDSAAPFVTPEPPTSPEVDDAPPKSRRKLLLIAGGAAAALLLVVLGALFFLGGGDDEEQATDTTTAPTTASADDPAEPTTTAPTTTAAPASTVPVEIPRQVSGTGTATVDVGRDVAEPYLGLITHDGPGSVSIELLGADGEVVQQLVGPGVSGQYLGVVPVNFASGSSFRSVRFTGDGPWAVTFAVPASAPTAENTSGTSFRSDGDRVVTFDAAESTRVEVECAACASPLEVIAWSDDTATQPKPLKDEDGVVVVPDGTSSLQIVATGPAGVMPAWTLTPS